MKQLLLISIMPLLQASSVGEKVAQRWGLAFNKQGTLARLSLLPTKEKQLKAIEDFKSVHTTCRGAAGILATAMLCTFSGFCFYRGQIAEINHGASLSSCLPFALGTFCCVGGVKQGASCFVDTGCHTELYDNCTGWKTTVNQMIRQLKSE